LSGKVVSIFIDVARETWLPNLQTGNQNLACGVAATPKTYLGESMHPNKLETFYSILKCKKICVCPDGLAGPSLCRPYWSEMPRCIKLA
jgi:hypothetical protein